LLKVESLLQFTSEMTVNSKRRQQDARRQSKFSFFTAFIDVFNLGKYGFKLYLEQGKRRKPKQGFNNESKKGYSCFPIIFNSVLNNLQQFLQSLICHFITINELNND
jgi:hypothetical protein